MEEASRQHNSHFILSFAEDFQKGVKEGRELTEASLTSVMRPIRGSNEYWAAEARKLEAMDQQLGKATFFLTLSCAEHHWSDMKAFLQRINEGDNSLNCQDIALLCARDPGDN